MNSLHPGRFYPGDDTFVFFSDMDVSNVVVPGKNLRQISAAGAKFSNVVFDKLNVVCALGSGKVVTTLTDCVFDRCVLKGPGSGWLSFERCEFRGTTLRDMILLGSSFVDCKFSGKIVNSEFCAAPPRSRELAVKAHNEIVDNDFTDCLF